MLALISSVVYLGLRRLGGGDWNGGSTAGLWFGIAGSALMIFAGLLSALRRVPSWSWLGSRQAWLRGHIWLGLLSGLLILFHSGGRWGGPLEVLLWIVLLAILVSGIVGLAFQWVLPSMITTRVEREAPFEQIPHLIGELRRRGDQVMEEVLSVVSADLGSTIGQLNLEARGQVHQFYEKEVRPFLSSDEKRTCLLADPLHAEVAFARLSKVPGMAEFHPKLVELASLCEERRQLARQERLHAWLHAWLMLHVPLSAALLVLGVAHVVGSLYY